MGLSGAPVPTKRMRTSVHSPSAMTISDPGPAFVMASFNSAASATRIAV